jgi:hypothetical protein
MLFLNKNSNKKLLIKKNILFKKLKLHLNGIHNVNKSDLKI